VPGRLRCPADCGARPIAVPGRLQCPADCRTPPIAVPGAPRLIVPIWGTANVEEFKRVEPSFFSRDRFSDRSGERKSTQRGVAMPSGVLAIPRAVQVNIEIMRAFTSRIAPVALQEPWRPIPIAGGGEDRWPLGCPRSISFRFPASDSVAGEESTLGAAHRVRRMLAAGDCGFVSADTLVLCWCRHIAFGNGVRDCMYSRH
jgi:hypothetical protein